MPANGLRPVDAMTRNNLAGESARALDEAIAWHLRLGDADERVWAEFGAWLEASPANRLAFDRVEDFDAELDNEDFSEFPDTPDFVNPLRRFAPWIIAGAGIAASFVLAFVFLNRAPAQVEYATAIGQARTIALADGTRIDLNTATTLLAGPTRRVTLEKGEVLFHVAKDASHPFIVTVGDSHVRVIGTVFDVLDDDNRLTVAVAEGRVGVSSRGSSGEIRLLPGDRLVRSETTGATSIEKVDPEQALAWRRGYLIYRDAPLSEVARDLNRYFPVPISLDDKAASQHFTGVLKIDTQDAMLGRIARFLPVRVDRTKDGKITLRGSAAPP